jgi:hypothetical protein
VVEQGGPSFADLLAGKQTANLRLASLDQYMHFERKLELRHPRRVGAILRRVFRRIMELHGVSDEADGGQTRSA